MQAVLSESILFTQQSLKLQHKTIKQQLGSLMILDLCLQIWPVNMVKILEGLCTGGLGDCPL